MPTTLYITGFADRDLTGEEQSKLDQNVSNWGAKNWSKDKYAPYDKRKPEFEVVYNTFADEPRADNKKIVIYGEMVIDNSEKQQVIDAVKELNTALPDVLFELNDDNGAINL